METSEKLWGGRRPNAGRKAGFGQYGEPTVSIRVPVSRRQVVECLLDGWRMDRGGTHRRLPGHLPKMANRVSAGAPRQCAEDQGESVDLFRHLVPHPESTYLLRISGWSMRDAGIADGDEVLVDRAIVPCPGDVVVAMLDEEVTVKRLDRDKHGRPVLRADNPDYAAVPIRAGTDLHLLGVVTRVLHRP